MTHSSFPGKVLFAASLIGLCGLGTAQGLTLSGTVTDSSQAPIPNVRVRVFDDNTPSTPSDKLLATVYTDNAGAYSAVITTGWTGARPDLYISVDWNFPLLQATAYGGKHVIVATRDGVAFTPKQTPTVNHDPAMDLPNHNLQMDQAQANLSDLRLHINEALDYYTNHRGTVAWSFNNDVVVKLVTTTVVSRALDYLEIAVVDITGSMGAPGQGFVSDIYHEVGHMVHYRFNGNALPSYTQVVPHMINTEGNPTAALVEGWPSYVARLTAMVHNPDMKYAAFEDRRRIYWRGDETSPTGYDSNRFESGEIVEGALTGVWTDIGTGTSFADNFGVMVNARPTNLAQFLSAFVAQSGGPGSAGALLAYKACNDHGIPYTRARFDQTAFMVDDPPDQGPPENGNVKEIGGKLFLRGKVKATVGSLTSADLGVQAALGTSQAGLYYKPAVTGTADAAATLTQSLAFSSPSGGSYEFNTIDFVGRSRGDGEWDLVIVSDNQDSFRDSLLPSWMGDGNASVSSDERYLKTIGAWYDKDRNPMTEDDGKVIVDNTAPTVDNFKP
jgi:hypothetical protein